MDGPMTRNTHNLLWVFDAANAFGEKKRFQCSKPYTPDHWDGDAFGAAMFYTITETEPGLLEEAGRTGATPWRVVPGTVAVYDVRPLSDVAT